MIFLALAMDGKYYMIIIADNRAIAHPNLFRTDRRIVIKNIILVGYELGLLEGLQ